MKLNKVLSIFALAITPLLTGFATTGCSSEDPTEQVDNVVALSNYEINFDAMNEQYPGEVRMEKAEDAWTALVKIGDKTIPAPTHLFGSVVNIIPYSNDDGGTDAGGKKWDRGDQVVAKYFKPGSIGIGLKNHRPEKRVVDLNSSDAANMKEDFKLQDTHIEVLVGVEKAEHGHPGVITLNNPQGYEDGRFGDSTYAPTFLSVELPDYAASYHAEYIDNIRSVLVGFNAVTNFPGDYNGGDPLGANTPEKMVEYTAQMVRAIAGDTAAQAWFQDPANQVYCAELAFISLSAGVIVPLNKSTMEPLVGADVWQKFTAQVDLHNQGVDEFAQTGEIANPSAFVKMNDNKRVGMVRITLAPDSLVNIAELAPYPEIARKLLALQAMTMADIVSQFMRTHIPRQLLGEALAPAQAAVLSKMRPGLLETMGMDRVPDDHPSKIAVNALFDQIIEVVGQQYSDYKAFRSALEPYMQQAQQITGPRPGADAEAGKGLFVPPSLFHVAAQGEYQGLLGIEYVGHGVHFDNVQQKAGAQPEPEPTEEPSLTCAHDPCETGEALTAENCARADVAAITSADAYCSNTEWDSICRDAAEAAGICAGTGGNQ